MPRLMPRPPHESMMVECFVAACSGSARLGEEIGRPVVLCNLAFDSTIAVGDLNRRHYGEATLWPGSFQPLEPQNGWNDWALFDLEASRTDCDLAAYGLRIEHGVIRLPLPPSTHIAEMRENLAAALRHLRFHDVVRTPAWLERRSEDPYAGLLVHPRYVLPDRRTFRGAKIVDDIYALDPTERLTSLLWRIVGAGLP